MLATLIIIIIIIIIIIESLRGLYHQWSLLSFNENDMLMRQRDNIGRGSQFLVTSSRVLEYGVLHSCVGGPYRPAR